MTTQKMPKEVAVTEFERWAETFEISTDTGDMDKDSKADFEAFKAKFVKRTQSGALKVDDDGVIEFTPRGADSAVRFPEPTGALLSARQDKDNDVQALRRVLAQWTGTPSARFAEMPLADFNFCAGLFSFFGAS